MPDRRPDLEHVVLGDRDRPEHLQRQRDQRQFRLAGILGGNTDAQGTLSIQCSPSLPYTVSLNGGNSGATDPTQRKMSFSGANVTYGLYQDAARTLPWGSTVGTDTASGTGTGVTQTQTVYGRVTAQTTPKPGSYTDSVVVTVGY